MTKLIGLTGAKRSGKNTVATIFEDHVDGTVLQTSFAAKLKAAAARALGFQGTEEELIALMDECKEHWEFGITGIGEDSATVKFFSGRHYLQWFGTEAGRETFGGSFWVDQVLPDPSEAVAAGGWVEAAPSVMLNLRYDQDYVLVTDLRFPNEAERIKLLGGVVWEVTRPGTGGDGHASERPLPRELVDLTIVNDGDKDALAAKVAVAVMSL